MIQEIKDKLLEMRRQILDELVETLKQEADTGKSDIGDIFDLAGTERDRELGLLLSNRDRAKLKAINDALERIEDGTYGVCEECEKKIRLERLKVMPFARYCVDCQSKMEKEESLRKSTAESNIYRKLAATEFDEET
ncbi:MAG: TraR/DksA family transcriptional regulator [Deltaproteobacteria bacterium]|nr:TraR/DksA family transcriptional regulator [Deltaproteobacteria bacterium]MBW2307012.1 TraR/DksA family transcriptional regulator [Deltaproteobacteria bacterium]